MASFDRRRWSAIGLGGVVAAFLGLAALYAFTVPKFLPADETSHVGYALTVGHGELPTLSSRVPDEVPGLALQYEIRREIYTANHPPLYYLPVAVPLRIGVATGHPVVGFELARLLTAALTAIGAVGTWAATRSLLPRRRDVAVLAAAIAVLLPAVPRFGGIVYNDGFSLAISAVALAATVRLLVAGPSRGRLAAIAIAAAALTLTRAVGLPMAGLVAASSALAVTLHSPRPLAARVGRGMLTGVLVAATAFVASGWFWLRSRHLYGDIAGSAYNLHRFGYRPRGTTAGLITDPHWPSVLYRQIWGRIYDNAELAVGRGAAPGALFALLVGAGVVALVVRRLRDRGWPSPAIVRDASPAERGRMVGWCVVAAWFGVIYVSTISYIASGGGVHGRYLFPGIPAVAILTATAVGALPGRRWGVAPIVTIALFTTTGLVWAARFGDRVRPQASWWGAALTATASAANGVPGGLVWLSILLAIAGTVCACVAVGRLARDLDLDSDRDIAAVVEATGESDASVALSEPRPPGGPDSP